MLNSRLSTGAYKITLCSDTRDACITPGSLDPLCELLEPTCNLVVLSFAGVIDITPKFGRQECYPYECMSQGLFAPLPNCLIPNAKGPLLSLILSDPGDRKGHRAMQVAKAAGGRIPGLLCCSAIQGPGTRPPFLCNGTGFSPVPGLERGQTEHPKAFQAIDE